MKEYGSTAKDRLGYCRVIIRVVLFKVESLASYK
mgnify:CR=1 FL=1